MSEPVKVEVVKSEPKITLDFGQKKVTFIKKVGVDFKTLWEGFKIKHSFFDEKEISWPRDFCLELRSSYGMVSTDFDPKAEMIKLSI